VQVPPSLPLAVWRMMSTYLSTGLDDLELFQRLEAGGDIVEPSSWRGGDNRRMMAGKVARMATGPWHNNGVQ
jgi:hypothetical protein